MQSELDKRLDEVTASKDEDAEVIRWGLKQRTTIWLELLLLFFSELVIIPMNCFVLKIGIIKKCAIELSTISELELI
jgi:hypothetical protein